MPGTHDVVTALFFAVALLVALAVLVALMRRYSAPDRDDDRGKIRD